LKKKRNKKSFVVIGTGNLAVHLTRALLKAGFTLKQVAGRNKAHTKNFAAAFKVPLTIDLNEVDQSADFYILCVNDDSIVDIAKKHHLKNKLVIHCSGSTPMNVLRMISSKYGVLYPLYTFSKTDKVKFEKIPVFIEGNTTAVTGEVSGIAKKIGGSVQQMSSDKREKLHLAAVMTANFSNYLFSLAHEYLARENVRDFKLLLPLLDKTVSKLKKYSPKEAQTGPARRHDKKVIQKHKSLLKKYPEQARTYALLSDEIGKRYLK
jgi:predicted short-subunit dehydrogenase-like oxidoreductase (DUF2520 family)